MAGVNAKDPVLNIFEAHLLNVCAFEGVDRTSNDLDSVAISSLVCKAEVSLEHELSAAIPIGRKRESQSDLGNNGSSEYVEDAPPAAKPTFQLLL